MRNYGRSSLYSGRSERLRRELPCTWMLGPERASGKTSLAGLFRLEFPADKGDKQRLTGMFSSTALCRTGYFAEHAGLIDTPGAILTQLGGIDAAGWSSTAWACCVSRKTRPFERAC